MELVGTIDANVNLCMMNVTGAESARADDSAGYVLMTAAYNEEANIEKTLNSVLSQTLPPKRWVIVSDGSTDRTDEIIRQYEKRCEVIRFLRLSRPPGHSFRSKVVALQAGSKLLEDVHCSFVGNIDGDISVAPTYFEDLIDHFRQDPTLGLVGGFVHEETEGEFRSRKSNRVHSVAHAAQLVRRECYQAIGGYQVLEHGGEDWYAQTCAKMKGWRTEAIPELQILHHRHTGAGTNLLRSSFRLGRLDYSFGSDPVFEIFKCFLRLPAHPFIIGALTRLAGFGWGYLRAERRSVPGEFIAFLRSEQRARVTSAFQRFHR